MNAKITLYSEKSLIDGMKEYAKMQNTSVSKLVTEFFTNTLKKKRVKMGERFDENSLPPGTKNLLGILEGKYESSEEAIECYHKYLEEKYLWKFC